MEGVPLKRIKRIEFESNLCIICQNSNTTEKTTSTENGCKKIRDCANLKRDDVYERLQLAEGEFRYHMTNTCYKRYVHYDKPSNISSISSSTSPSVSSEIENESNRITRSQFTPRPACSPAPDIYKTSCVICGCCANKHIYEKFRVSEDNRADRLLKATVYYSDEVYVRTCDLQDINSVFGADLYCHKNCIRLYLLKYDRALKKDEDAITSPKVSEKERVFKSVLADINSDLQNGRGYPLSGMRDLCNNIINTTEHRSFTNKELKVLLLHHFGDEISFTVPPNPTHSSMIFISSIDKGDIAEAVRNSNPVKETAVMMREILLQECDPLEDKFCDANDLSDAWQDIAIPKPILEFLCVLLNVDYKLFYKDDENNSKISIMKRRKIMALYQIIFYDVNNGEKKTPFHVLTSEMIHNECRSKTLITAFNHYGLGISYPELLRYHTDLASYTLNEKNNNVPLPSHFNTISHTTAAFDNFDHNEHTPSGLGSSHDTVAILIQDKPEVVHRKPNVSSTTVIHGDKSSIGPLPCQKLQEFYKSSKKIELPNNYNPSTTLFSLQDDVHTDIQMNDVAWILSRLDLSNLSGNVIDAVTGEQTMPTWSAFNSIISNENHKVQQVGFLPVLPHPVTKYETVYTSLKNFMNILNQLHQKQMAIFCDEGVYHIAREIMLQKPDEFAGLVICLGSFHLIKTLLACIGKYLSGSGCRTIWTESKAFGLDVVESVLSGSDYERSVEGITLLGECISRLQWGEFLQNNASNYNDELGKIKALKEAVSQKKKEESQKYLQEFKVLSSDLLKDFNNFRIERSKSSENFRYWDNFVKMVHNLLDLIRADREGNWGLHLNAVKESMSLFIIFDRINYTRWCSIYLEDMQKLSETAPDVYEAFLAGKFSVKRSPGTFNSVGTDMCLEQTINRSSKSKGGVVGETRRKDFFTMWNLIYHERLAINILGWKLSGAEFDKRELLVHHKFTEAETTRQEKIIKDMIMFIVSHENPLTISSETHLHHILTQEILHEDIRKDLLSVFQTGEDLYTQFRKKRFLERTEKVSDTIHRRNLKTFDSARVHQTKPNKAKAVKDSKKDIVKAQKTIDLARVRKFDVKELFKYNLVLSSYLFEADGLMTTSQKSLLLKEIEKHLNDEDFTYSSSSLQMKHTYLVDVMANVRKIDLTRIRSFGELCKSFLAYVLSLSIHASEIHFVFDWYKEGTVKDSERSRRYQSRPIDISVIKNDTSLPVEMASFWVSNSNKAKLQNLLRSHITKFSESHGTTCFIVSATMVDGNIIPCQKLNPPEVIDELNLDIEEADIRLLPHAKHAAEHGTEKIVILSNDTDVIVGFIYHCQDLINVGLKELWMRVCVGKTTRLIPIHTLVNNLGSSLCKQIPAMHCLTGHDANSKFGTKLAGLKQLPVADLEKFGKDPRLNPVEDMLATAERYLVKVLKAASPCETMDDLRYYIYHHSKSHSFIDLPPTTFETRGHCMRAICNTYLYLYAMMSESMPRLDPLYYGYEKSDDLLIPSRYHQTFPEGLIQPCVCGACATSRCICKIGGVACCEYCKCCGNRSVCKNKTT